MSTSSGQFKRAQIVMSCLLLCLCLVGHWILDLRRSTGCRIFMPVLTILLTAAHESVHGFFETSQEKGLTQRAAVCVSLGTAVFALSAVCFGVSPLKTLDIFIWSFFFSTLVGMPGACLLTSDLASWQRAYVTLRPQSVSERVCCVTFCSAALGAWLGAWAVPLDWRASWQEWPIPCFLGSVGGCLAGSAVLVRGLGLAEEREREEEGRRSREREKYEAEGRKKREGLEKPEVNEANWWMFM